MLLRNCGTCSVIMIRSSYKPASNELIIHKNMACCGLMVCSLLTSNMLCKHGTCPKILSNQVTISDQSITVLSTYLKKFRCLGIHFLSTV